MKRDLIYMLRTNSIWAITDSILGYMCTPGISKSLHIKWFTY